MCVAQRVVEHLELVHVDEYQRPLSAGLGVLEQQMFEPLEQQQAVRQ